jgi:hypothetical protein
LELTHILRETGRVVLISATDRFKALKAKGAPGTVSDSTMEDRRSIYPLWSSIPRRTACACSREIAVTGFREKLN